MTLVGYSVLVALPAINSAWVDQLGFTEVEVNRVASADLMGLFLGASTTAALITIAAMPIQASPVRGRGAARVSGCSADERSVVGMILTNGSVTT